MIDLNSPFGCGLVLLAFWYLVFIVMLRYSTTGRHGTLQDLMLIRLCISRYGVHENPQAKMPFFEEKQEFY